MSLQMPWLRALPLSATWVLLATTLRAAKSTATTFCAKKCLTVPLYARRLCTKKSRPFLILSTSSQPKMSRNPSANCSPAAFTQEHARYARCMPLAQSAFGTFSFPHTPKVASAKNDAEDVVEARTDDAQTGTKVAILRLRPVELHSRGSLAYFTTGHRRSTIRSAPFLSLTKKGSWSLYEPASTSTVSG